MIILSSSDPTTNPLNDFLKNYGIWIAVGLAALVFIAVLIMFFISLKKRKEEGITNNTKKVISVSDKSKDILEALGGKENILEHSFIGSRMTLVLKDYSIVNEEKLNQSGVDSIIKMANKIILVIKDDLSNIYRELFSI